MYPWQFLSECTLVSVNFHYFLLALEKKKKKKLIISRQMQRSFLEVQ